MESRTSEPSTSVPPSPSTTPPSALLKALRAAQGPAFFSAVQELLTRFAGALGVQIVRICSNASRSQHLLIERPPVWLRGYSKDHTHVLFLAASDNHWTRTNSAFRKRINSPFDLPIIIATTDEAAEFAIKEFGSHGCVIINTEDLTRILEAADGADVFKSVLLSQHSVRSLHPFDDQHPVAGPFFVGRDDYLNLLLERPTTHYAIVAPSKMGKTSLIEEYKLKLQKIPKLNRLVFYCNLYNVDGTDEAVARAIRMAIEPSSSAYYKDPRLLHQFIHKTHARYGLPLEIIVDEADAHCKLTTIRNLISLSDERSEICRLILIGRWELLKTAVHIQDHDYKRLKPLRLEPLDTKDSEELITKPLTDLGFDCTSSRHELRSAIQQCGRVPGHLHEFGRELVHEMVASGENHLSKTVISKALDSILSSERLLGLLNDLSSHAARTAALVIALREDRVSAISREWLRDNLVSLGVELTILKVWELCDELVMNHLLTFSDRRYRVNRWDFAADGRRERTFYTEVLREEAELAITEQGEGNQCH